MMDNYLEYNEEETKLEPNKIAVRLNRMTSSSFDRNQAMRKIDMAVNTYVYCDVCQPLKILTPDAVDPSLMVCTEDTFCVM